MANKNKKDKDIDQLSGTETTGHVWDGIRELNTPSPRWWLITFVITIIWAIGYWIVYPAWPTLEGHTKGIKGWTSYQQLAESREEIMARKAGRLERLAKTPLERVKENSDLYQFSLAGGAAAFKNHCAVCHGTGAEGQKGYPNLNDDDWLWGGKVDEIYTTIKYGIRSDHEDTYVSDMPAFARDELLETADIRTLTDYIQALPNSKDITSHAGATLFADNCASCHGEDAKGNQEVGAPNLADAIWLFGDSREDIIYTISNSRKGVMPHWEGKLDDNTIKQLALYVHSLGAGE